MTDIKTVAVVGTGVIGAAKQGSRLFLQRFATQQFATLRDEVLPGVRSAGSLLFDRSGLFGGGLIVAPWLDTDDDSLLLILLSPARQIILAALLGGAVATLLTEDFACIGAGLLVAQGRIGFFAVSTA